MHLERLIHHAVSHYICLDSRFFYECIAKSGICISLKLGDLTSLILLHSVQIYDYSTNGCLHHVRAFFLYLFICKVCSKVFKEMLPKTILLLEENCRQIGAQAMEEAEEEEREVSLSSESLPQSCQY